MRILVLTLMMSVVSQGVFGAAEGGRVSAASGTGEQRNFVKFLQKTSNFNDVTLTTLTDEQKVALVEAQLPRDHPWRKADLSSEDQHVKQHTVDSDDGSTSFSFYQKSNGFVRFLTRFAVQSVIDELGLTGIIFPKAWVVIRDNSKEEVFITHPGELQDDFDVTIFVSHADNKRVELNKNAASALGELLWYVRLDIGGRGGNGVNIHTDDSGNAVIIDCEDKGEHWITNIQKLWERLPASEEAREFQNGQQLPLFRRCVGKMFAKYIRQVNGKGFSIKYNKEGKIKSYRRPHGVFFLFSELQPEDDEEFGSRYCERSRNDIYGNMVLSEGGKYLQCAEVWDFATAAIKASELAKIKRES